jgi:hypothetical protein
MPEFHLFSRLHNPKENEQYLNSTSKTLPLGLGFGGFLHSVGRNSQYSTTRPRLWIDADFSKCFTSSYDITFANGSLLVSEVEFDFSILQLEVWGPTQTPHKSSFVKCIRE